MKYQYYKDKYKSYNVKLDRVADAEIINMLDSFQDGPKALIMIALRALKAAMLTAPRKEDNK